MGPQTLPTTPDLNVEQDLADVRTPDLNANPMIVVDAVIRIARIRSRPACRIASSVAIPALRSWFM